VPSRFSSAALVGASHKVSAKHLPATGKGHNPFNHRGNQFLFWDTLMLLASDCLEYKELRKAAS
jgi:hypothetical protein